jgi:hypothetical protein
VEHEVAAVEVAVTEDPRPRGELLGELVEAFGEDRSILDGEVAAPQALEEVLRKVVQLPGELLDVERVVEAVFSLRGTSGLPRWRIAIWSTASRYNPSRSAEAASRSTSWRGRSPRSCWIRMPRAPSCSRISGTGRPQPAMRPRTTPNGIVSRSKGSG